MRKFLSLFTVLACAFLLVHAQTRRLTGKVLDDKGNAIPYATVKIKGKNAGASADQNGNFELQVAAKDVLVISSIGFSAEEITVGSLGSVSVTLKGNKLMEEVIVTAQGIRRRPRELGYSVAKVASDDIMVGRSPQVAQSLSGKVSGLAVFNVNNSVDPAVKITLRGYRSLTGNNDALLVIDGLPTPGSQTMLSLLNPNDIESITVLKGGQAATLYGSDGVNGALVITTKKGGKGKARVTYSNATNIEKVNILAQFQDKYGSGSHYAAGFGTAGYKTDPLARQKDNWRSYENQQFGDRYDGTMRPAGRTLEDGSVNMLPYSAIPGERERIWNKGVTTNNQLSISGGNDQSSFYLSLENNLATGVVPKDKSNRNGVRLSATTESGRLRAGFNLAYIQANYDRTTFDFYNESINQAAHIPLSQYKDWQNNKFASPNAYYNDYFSNPYFMLDNQRTKYQDADITGSLDLNYKITGWLNVYNRVGILNNSRNRKSTVGKFIYSDWAKTKAVVPAPYDQGDGAGITRTLTDIQGSVFDQISTENILNNDLQLQTNKDFGNFSTKGLVGFNIYERKTKDVNMSSSSIVVPGVYNVSNRQGELAGGEGNTDYRKFGYYADLLGGWKDMIYLHGTFRYDASSKFYKPNRASNLYSYAYYGFDASVMLTELIPQIKGKFLSYAKLRAGYNKNANDGLGSTGLIYGLDPTFSNAGGFPYGNTVGISVGDVLPDANLKPEIVKSWEGGADLQFLNGRVSLDLTYYTQRSIGSVVTVKIPNTTGFSNLRLNVGETKNWGYETDLRLQLVRAKKFSWDFNVRYSYNDNKVIELYPGVDEFSYGAFSYAAPYVIKNQSFPALKAISYVRDPATNAVIVGKADGYPLTTGPLKNFGRTIPKHILGWGTTIKYSAFALTTNFEYRGGNVVYSDLGRQMTFTGSGKWTENRDPYVFPNSAYDDGTGKFVPNTNVNVREAEYALWADKYRLIAENFVTPGWFVKLRDINLSYTVPANALSKIKIFSGAVIALYGRNLITIVDKANDFTDPEFSFTTDNGQGVNTTAQTPPVRQYGFNINLTFK